MSEFELQMPNTRLSGSVLVVDDDEGVRRVIARWAMDLGHNVKTATQADEAVDVLRQQPIDVVVSDVRMPGRDGVWLVDQIGRTMPHIAIVLATGLTEMDPSVTLRPGVVGYIVKPFNRQDLDEMIQRGLAQSRAYTARNPVKAALPAAGGDDIVDGVLLARF